jgi:hypothetical protein
MFPGHTQHMFPGLGNNNNGSAGSPGLAPGLAPPAVVLQCKDCNGSLNGGFSFHGPCTCGASEEQRFRDEQAEVQHVLGNNNNGSAGSPGLQNFSSLGFGNANNNNALNTSLNNAASAASSPATPATGGGFSFDGPPSASSSFSSSPSTLGRISGQASPKMLMVSQKNIQIKAEAAMTDILVNRWGPHMLEMLMKEFNSMPDSQQLEQMMCSWLPGNNIKKI